MNGGTRPTPPRDRRFKQVQETAQPPRYQHQSFARPRENRRGHTKHPGPPNQNAQHNQTQKHQAQPNHTQSNANSTWKPKLSQREQKPNPLGSATPPGRESRTTRQGGGIRREYERQNPCGHAGPRNLWERGRASARANVCESACVCARPGIRK